MVFGITVLDQLSKFCARQWLGDGSSFSYLFGLVKLQLAYNSGAFLSLGAGWPHVLRWIVFIGFVFIFLYFLWKLLMNPKNSRMQDLSYMMILGGGVGNLIDRIFLGEVTDFLWVGLGVLQTGIFNFADMMILIGVVCLFGEELWNKIHSKIHSNNK